MKALTWQRWISIGAAALLLALAIQPVMATIPGLPAGLPALPGLSGLMQRDARTGLALDGFDPVAYQAEQRATPGSPDFELMHRGIVWRFASAANRAAFVEAPEVYEPAFAGFDAAGIADGFAVDADPRRFAIIGARLFLFQSEDSRRDFVGDAALRRLAESHWDDVRRALSR